MKYCMEDCVRPNALLLMIAMLLLAFYDSFVASCIVDGEESFPISWFCVVLAEDG
jgi:hypothetical protein